MTTRVLELAEQLKVGTDDLLAVIKKLRATTKTTQNESKAQHESSLNYHLLIDVILVLAAGAFVLFASNQVKNKND